MDKTYCIYTDKVVSINKTNLEHIIPLGLGGCNGFCIRVDKTKNSALGSHIDGKLSNDFLISLLRRHKDFRGHSGKAPETRLRKSKLQQLINQFMYLLLKRKFNSTTQLIKENF